MQYPRPMCYVEAASSKLVGGQIGHLHGVSSCLRDHANQPSDQATLDYALVRCTNTTDNGVIFGNTIDLTIQDDNDKSKPGKPTLPTLVNKTGGAITLRLNLPENNGGGAFESFFLYTNNQYSDTFTSQPLDLVASDGGASLGRCQGHCNFDSDCAGNLRCWSGSGDVPECTGTKISSKKYCFYQGPSIEAIKIDNLYQDYPPGRMSSYKNQRHT